MTMEAAGRHDIYKVDKVHLHKEGLNLTMWEGQPRKYSFSCLQLSIKPAVRVNFGGMFLWTNVFPFWPKFVQAGFPSVQNKSVLRNVYCQMLLCIISSFGVQSTTWQNKTVFIYYLYLRKFGWKVKFWEIVNIFRQQDIDLQRYLHLPLLYW